MANAIFSELAEWTGLELRDPGVTGRYSNQLNYHQQAEIARMHGIAEYRLGLRSGWSKPATPGVTGRYSNQLNYHS